jgi:hypothetical protein
MSEPFDPYRKWLGIPPKDSAGGGPNHYRLLGIAPFESDPDVIENAATRQMAHVRTFKTGRHSALSQKILNELSAAKLCLLSPEQKQVYDAQLRVQLAAAGKLSDSMLLSGVPLPPLPESAVPPPPPLARDERWRTEDMAEPQIASPPPVPIPMPVGTAVAPMGTAVAPVGTLVAPVPMIRGSSVSALRARRSNSALPLALSIMCLVILAGAAAAAALVFGGMVDLGGVREPGRSAGKHNGSPVRVEKPADESSGRSSRKSRATDFPIGTSGEKPATGPAEPAADGSPADDW